MPAIVGSLTTPLAGYIGSNPDNTDTLQVNLNASDGVLSSVSTAAAANGSSICILQDVSGFEIIAYTTATLIGSYTYALTGLYRGLYGTTNRYFGSGSNFMFVGTGGNYFETSLPPAYIGSKFYVKAQSFNIFNQVDQDLSTCVAYVYNTQGSSPKGPTPPPTISATYRRISNTPNTVKVPSRKRKV
jgi:hypothetical protein